MTSPAKPLMRPSLATQRPSLETITQAVNEHAAERGIPTVVPTPSPAAEVQEHSATTSESVVKIAPTKKGKGTVAADETQAPTKRLSVDIPDYLRDELRKRSANTNNTIKYIICRALKKDGFQVEARDLVEDGRREH